MRVGVLDAGSNTVRLDVADLTEAGPLPVHTVKHRLRLAGFVDEEGFLPPQAVSRLADAVAHAHKEAQEWRVVRLEAFATAIIRDAPNQREVVETVRAASGLELRMMSGRREAELTFQAARAWMGWRAGPMVVLDIGGGSLEVAFGRTGLPDFATSVPLGAGRLTREHFGTADPPPVQVVETLRRHVSGELQEIAARIRAEEPHTAVATSRTFQQLARLCGAPPRQLSPHSRPKLARADLGKAVKQLAGMPAADRADLPGISRARSKQSLAGAVVAHTAMKQMGLSYVSICPWAVREGLLLQQLPQA